MLAAFIPQNSYNSIKKNKKIVSVAINGQSAKDKKSNFGYSKDFLKGTQSFLQKNKRIFVFN